MYVGTNTDTGSTHENIVALKRYKAREGLVAAIQRDVTNVNLLVAPHENLCSAHLLQDEGDTWIVESLWKGSLEDLIKKHGPRRDILEILHIAEHLFSGLAQLHKHGFRHTDIKPDNCGIRAASSHDRVYVLGDFGCLSSSPDLMPSDGRLLGTLRTRAPEVIGHGRISLKSDVWAMAATIFSLCLEKYPFVPFEAPHDNAEDRTAREQEIKSNLAMLTEQHRKDVGRLLPPILSLELGKCFGEEETRPLAESMAESFRSKRSELSKQSDKLSHTAWQRAEDIVRGFDKETALIRGARLLAPQETEIRDLITKYRDFVPEELRKALGDFLPSEQ